VAVTRPHLVRHGQSTWNAARSLQGQTAHVELTALRLGHAAADALRRKHVDAVYSSDLLRAVQTALPIAAALRQPIRRTPGPARALLRHVRGLDVRGRSGCDFRPRLD